MIFLSILKVRCNKIPEYLFRPLYFYTAVAEQLDLCHIALNIIYSINNKDEKLMNCHRLLKYRLLITLAAVAFLSGCVSQSAYLSVSALAPPLNSKVVVFPVQAFIAESKALSSAEVSADESAAVAGIIGEEIMEYMFDKGIEYVPYGASDTKDEHIGLVRQAAVIADAAGGEASSNNRFYALSKESLESVKEYGANYVLLSEYSRTSPSDGKAVLGLLIGGAPDTFVGFSWALFDLRDGQLVWSHGQRMVGTKAYSGVTPVIKESTSKEKVTERVGAMMVNFPLK